MTQTPIIQRTDQAERGAFQDNYIEGKGKGRHGWLDTFGYIDGLFWSGGRQKDIQEILDDPSTKYDPSTGGYNLNPWQRRVSGITDQDIFNARRSRETEQLKAAYGADAEAANIKIDGSTSTVDVLSGIKNDQAYREEAPKLRGALQAVGGGHGTAALKALGPKPSIEQLQGALTKAQQAWEVDPKNETSQTLQLRDAKTKDQQLAGERNLQAKRQNDLAKERLALEKQTSRLNTDTARIQAANEKELAMYKIKAAEIEAQRARQDRLATQASDSEARQMQMQFEYARLAQQDRQARQDKKDKALMMLLQGLGNLGTAFTI